MKDLIKEIEKLKDFSLEDSALDIVIREITNENVDKVLSILNQYNLITAPKSIKLSEILGKLNDNEWKDFQATKQDNIISIDNNNNFRQYFNIDKNKITEISEEMQANEFKWLYALWVADSKIIDDLGEENNEIDTVEEIKVLIAKANAYDTISKQLGCPLEVVFKAIKSNVWNNKTKRQEWVVLDYSNGEFVLKTTKELYVDDNKSILPLKEYGTTWWLKGEKE